MKIIKLGLLLTALPIYSSNRFERPVPSPIKSLSQISLGVTFLLGSFISGAYGINAGLRVYNTINADSLARDAEKTTLGQVGKKVSETVNNAISDPSETIAKVVVDVPATVIKGVYNTGTKIAEKVENQTGIWSWVKNQASSYKTVFWGNDSKSTQADKSNVDASNIPTPSVSNLESNNKNTNSKKDDDSLGQKIAAALKDRVPQISESVVTNFAKSVGWGTLSITLGVSGIYYIGKGLGFWGYEKEKDKAKKRIRSRIEE